MSEESLFHETLSNPPAERAAFLEKACVGQPQLRAAVETLLAAHEQPGDLLDVPPGSLPATDEHTPQRQGTPTSVYQPRDLEPGIVIHGRYTLVEKFGEGGMGEVWVAKQTEPVRRNVALKLIKAGMDSKSILTRFEQERQALAMMDHPNIARVFDGGVTPGGHPFFVMELVNGLPLTKFCDDARLTPRQRLELFVPICQAVQHAHQKGIVHRDLKPSNILVTLIDAKPIPKVIDFGVAKATGGKLTDDSLSTHFGAVVGTLEYLSPEQARFSGIDVDTRADIYSLGVILYELLTGLRPFEGKCLRDAALDEMIRIIQEEVPSKPSTRLSTDESLPSLAALRQTDPKKLMALLRGELDWVVMKCLEKNRGRRYETANALARDIQRYLADEPVEARPPSLGYRASKFLRRNKGPVLAASLLLLALVAGIVGTTIGLIRAEKALAAEAEQRGIAQAKENEAEAQKKRAIEFRDKALDALRATTGEDVEKLIAEKKELGANERAYLEAIVKRWQTFAAQEGDDEQARAVRGEGHFRSAFLWAKLGRKEEAREEYQAARDIQKKLVEQFPAVPAYQHGLANTHNNLGLLLADLGKGDVARAEYQAACDIKKKLVEQFPAVSAYQQDLARTHISRGILLADLGKGDEARAEYQAARGLQKKLVGQFPAVPDYRKDLASTHNNLGLLLADLGKGDEARAEYQAARDLRKQLVERFPAVPEYQQELAVTHNNLGNLLAGLGQRQEARAEYEAARVIQKKLVEQFPAVPGYRQDLANADNCLGNLLDGLGQREEARAEYEAARVIQKKLVEQFPAVPRYQQDLANTHNNLGALVAGLGQREEARAEYEAARVIQKKLAERFPALPAYQIELGGSYCNYGNLIREEGKPAESLEWFDLAVQTLKPIHDTEPRHVTAKLFLRNSHWGRADAYTRLKKPVEAVKDWGRAIDLSPPAERPGLRASRATSQIQAGMVAEAVAEVADLAAPDANATGLANWNAGQRYDFACIYAVASTKIADKKQEYADRAMEWLQQAVKAGYKDAAQMGKAIGLDPLRERADFKKLLAELETKTTAPVEKQP